MVRSSRNMIAGTTAATSHPRSAAIPRATRCFTSRRPSRSWTSCTSVLISTTRRIPRPGMVGKNVEPTTITVVVEAGLDLHQPSGAAQRLGEPVLKTRVAPIRQGARAGHAEVQHEARVERSGPTIQQAYVAALERSAFEVAHPLLRDLELAGELPLRPSALPAKRSEHSGDASPFHLPMLPWPCLPAAYEPITDPIGASRYRLL